MSSKKLQRPAQKVPSKSTVKKQDHVIVRSPKNGQDYIGRTRPKEPIWLGPPAYKAQMIRPWMVRTSVAASGTEQTLTSFQLASMLGVISTSTTTSVFLTESFRLRRVRIWAITTSYGTPTEVMLKIADAATSGGQSGPPCTVMDSSASIDKPAFCELVIPETSIFARWQDVSSTNSFLVYLANSEAVMDLHYEFIIDDLGTLVAGPAISAGTLGVIYHKDVATLTAAVPLNRIP